MAFSIPMMFHPTLHVPDLEEVENFFERVFHRPTTVGGTSQRKTYATGYNRHTNIAEVLIVSVDPKKHIINGQQPYPAVPDPRLKTIGWYAWNCPELYKVLHENGINTEAQFGQVDTGDGPPMGSFGDYIIFFTRAEDAGLRYEFLSWDDDKAVTRKIASDERLDPGWQAGTNDWDPKPDPLGIRKCAQHTILTRDVPRSLKFHEVIGGQVIGDGYNELLDCDSTYVALADSVIEIATPRSDESRGAEDWRGEPSLDTYHSMTWLVEDVDAVATYLESVKVGIRARNETTLMVDAADGLGVPWGFSTVLVPGDTR